MSGDLYRTIVLGLTRNVAFTSPRSQDHRLRGRTYAVPFDAVWRAALDVLDNGEDGWELMEADDEEGIVRGVAHAAIGYFDSALTVRIGLDANAQTRVDGFSASRSARADLGTNARTLGRFFEALDRTLEARRGTPISALRLDRAESRAVQVG